MADRYWGRLEFPWQFIDQEVTEALKAEGVEMDNLDPSGHDDDSAWVEDGIFTMENSQARYGQFEELEDLLILKKIPFDRESGGLYEFIPERRIFRPSIDEDMVFLLCDGKIALDLEEIRAQLSIGEFALQAYLNEKFPDYTPLRDYVEAD
jgi:hypothetical protein